MSYFTESTWEANAVGDKLSREIFQKNNKSYVKCGKRDVKVPKSIKRLHDDKLTTKHAQRRAKKRQQALLESVETGQFPVKKWERKPKVDEDANDKTETPAIPIEAQSGAKTKSQRRREKHRMNKLAGDKARQALLDQSADSGAPSDATMRTTQTMSKTKKRRENMKQMKIARRMEMEKNAPSSDVLHSTGEKLPLASSDIQKLQEQLATKDKSAEKSTGPETLRERMMSQLSASRFRFLNETLYTSESSVSKQYFKEDPEAFAAYHAGYRQQVEQWPINPLDIVITAIDKMPKDIIIADFGCGDARLADSVSQKVHSFDLVAVNDKVKACDMAHTPLLTNSVNVVVFCLSLMGTNLNDYLLEANRVLKKDGILKIADVESRFENVDEFINLLKNYGFVNTWKDLSHNLFYFMDFKKSTDVNRGMKNLPEISLKPCLYKKR